MEGNPPAFPKNSCHLTAEGSKDRNVPLGFSGAIKPRYVPSLIALEYLYSITATI